jgi:hypothetical protein
VSIGEATTLFNRSYVFADFDSDGMVGVVKACAVLARCQHPVAIRPARQLRRKLRRAVGNAPVTTAAGLLVPFGKTLPSKSNAKVVPRPLTMFSHLCLGKPS